jgi:hypothetical protein
MGGLASMIQGRKAFAAVACDAYPITPLRSATGTDGAVELHGGAGFYSSRP